MTARYITVKAQTAEDLFGRSLREIQGLTDRVFAVLLLAEWAAAVLCAVFVSPLTWEGGASSPHTHVYAAIGLGGLLTCFPVWLAYAHRGAFVTRMIVASSQVMFSALLIHLMSGRIEAHFHIFGSLALLSFYRDYRVFGPAVALVLADHVLRGVFWPESVFGVSTPELLRAFEHAGWVLFEVTFLLWGVAQSRSHLLRMAELQASLESERDSLEERVAERTVELAEARDYLERIIDSLDAHICILDEEGEILTTNSAWRAYAVRQGGSYERTNRGANYLTACRGAYGDCRNASLALADGIESVIEGRADRFVSEYACDEPGVRRWYQVRVSPYVGVGKAAAVVAHVDVTDRVNATHASKEEAQRAADLAQIIIESPNEVYIFNQDDLRFEVVNKGAVKATGYSRDELLRMKPLDLNPEFEDATFRAKMKLLSQDESSVIEFQTHHRRCDGLTYPVQVSLHAAEFGGKPVYVAFVTDLSEVRRLEGRLAQSQKLESIGQLAAGIAHEINTPMQCVSNNVEFLQDCHVRLFDIIDRLIESIDSPAKPWSERKEEVKRIIEEARYQRIASLAPSAIQDASEASRRVIEIVRAMKVMSHPGTRDFVETDVNDTLRNAATIARNRWKYSAEVVFELDDTLPMIPALPAEINQVFLNLIVNAADAIAEKNGEGGKLGKITLRTRREGDSVRIEIDDTGTGVPKELRARVFDPFFTTKEVGKGTGQGLAITYDAIVNKHRGTIDLLSTEGEGATFVVCLPIDPSAKAYAKPAAEAVG